MKALYTIGYEGAVLDDFLITLRQAGITLLLDIREIPISRRKGFSKTVLKHAVETVGLQYLHEKRLGSPKPIRDQLHRDRDYTTFFKHFNNYLETQTDLLQTLADQLPGKVALLCYERDPQTCHRREVARALAELTGLTPRHLGVRKGHGTRPPKTTARVDSGQSVPATEPAI
ncbi:MAG TPA: DUF488 domain-containing protein [Candidatus Competibacter phosphatis]|nr:DUF488 domain-containing protein [Candidatus Competibacter phosphatis]